MLLEGSKKEHWPKMGNSFNYVPFCISTNISSKAWFKKSSHHFAMPYKMLKTFLDALKKLWRLLKCLKNVTQVSWCLKNVLKVSRCLNNVMKVSRCLKNVTKVSESLKNVMMVSKVFLEVLQSSAECWNACFSYIKWKENLHSVIVPMSRNSLIETSAISES